MGMHSRLKKFMGGGLNARALKSLNLLAHPPKHRVLPSDCSVKNEIRPFWRHAFSMQTRYHE